MRSKPTVQSKPDLTVRVGYQFLLKVMENLLDEMNKITKSESCGGNYPTLSNKEKGHGGLGDRPFINMMNRHSYQSYPQAPNITQNDANSKIIEISWSFNKSHYNNNKSNMFFMTIHPLKNYHLKLTISSKQTREYFSQGFCKMLELHILSSRRIMVNDISSEHALGSLVVYFCIILSN